METSSYFSLNATMCMLNAKKSVLEFGTIWATYYSSLFFSFLLFAYKLKRKCISRKCKKMQFKFRYHQNIYTHGGYNTTLILEFHKQQSISMFYERILSIMTTCFPANLKTRHYFTT